jgi:hypothetical protein
MSVYFKTSENKTSIDPDKIYEKIHIYKQAVGKIALKILLPIELS